MSEKLKNILTLEKLALEILSKLDEGVNIVDKNGILVYSNKLSADYVGEEAVNMIGNHISNYYPQAALINVIKTGKSVRFSRVVHENGQIYKVRAYPILDGNILKGGYAIFNDITELNKLTEDIELLKTQIIEEEKDGIFSRIVGYNKSLKDAVITAKRSVGTLGGARHSIITGESGTGKTMLAKMIYLYAKEVGVINEDAPFLEINCAQYTNSDIAAMEIFGSKEGAFTGAKEKKGLFELANGGILFLDEAHKLENYQSLLLKAIETKRIRRVGGSDDIETDVIVIAASTEELSEVLLPELYQRLAQYEIYLPPLNERSNFEKIKLIDTFIDNYQRNTKGLYDIDLKIVFSDNAKKTLINADYPRNIRQFRDTINRIIDSTVPLLETNIKSEEILIPIENKDVLKLSCLKTDEKDHCIKVSPTDILNEIEDTNKYILELYKGGLGARRISNILKNEGIDLEYYQVSYRLQKLKDKGKL